MCTDMLVEGRHFRLDWSTPHDVGRKAIAQNAADIEAMGARTTAFVVAFGAPGDTSTERAVELADGMWHEAGLHWCGHRRRRHGARAAVGDLGDGARRSGRARAGAAQRRQAGRHGGGHRRTRPLCCRIRVVAQRQSTDSSALRQAPSGARAAVRSGRGRGAGGCDRDDRCLRRAAGRCGAHRLGLRRPHRRCPPRRCASTSMRSPRRRRYGRRSVGVGARRWGRSRAGRDVPRRAAARLAVDRHRRGRREAGRRRAGSPWTARRGTETRAGSRSERVAR